MSSGKRDCTGAPKSLENLSMDRLLKHFLSPRDGDESLKDTVVETVFNIDGMPDKLVNFIASNDRLLKKVKEAIEHKSTDELLTADVFDILEQTVLIMAGGDDGIAESHACVAVLFELPRWLQMFLLVMKETLSTSPLTLADPCPYPSINYNDSSTWSDIFESLNGSGCFLLEDLRELAVECCDAEGYQCDDDDKKIEYFSEKIAEAIDDVALNTLDVDSVINIVNRMEIYKKKHPIMMTPFMVLRVDHVDI